MDQMSILLPPTAQGQGPAPPSVQKMSASSSDEEAVRKRVSRKRKNTDATNQDKPMQPLRTLKQYMIEEKLDIINFAKQMGNRAAGREYNVAESSIREWRKNEERLKATLQTEPTRNRLIGGGRKATTVPKQSRDSSADMEHCREVIHVPLSLRLMDDRDDSLNSSGSTSFVSCSSDSSASPMQAATSMQQHNFVSNGARHVISNFKQHSATGTQSRMLLDGCGNQPSGSNSALSGPGTASARPNVQVEARDPAVLSLLQAWLNGQAKPMDPAILSQILAQVTKSGGAGVGQATLLAAMPNKAPPSMVPSSHSYSNSVPAVPSKKARDPLSQPQPVCGASSILKSSATSSSPMSTSGSSTPVPTGSRKRKSAAPKKLVIDDEIENVASVV